MLMAGKGNKRHIKTLNAPKYLDMHSKESAYVVRPNPGRHVLKRSVALVLALRKMGVVEESFIAKKVLNSGKVKVNGNVVRNPRYPVGLNDVIEITDEGKAYRVGISKKGKVSFEEAKQGEEMLYKVIGKYKGKKGQLMLRVHDGSNIKADKGNEISTGDSVVLDKDGKIAKAIRLAVDAECRIIDGVHVGEQGKIIEIKKADQHKEQSATIESKSGEKFETVVRNLIVTG